MTSPYPRLAVVGHPNRGKSSLVAALLQNSQVAISALSGTTVRAEAYPLMLDGRTQLELVDTPGFQRARALLDFLHQDDMALLSRPERLQALVARPELALRFHDEVELLKPLLAGAAMLYVVDANAPITQADRAEMELLLWTGQPRMAVINPFAESRYLQDWQQLLSQHFGQVLVFNPLTDDFSKRLELLQALAWLTPAWHAHLTQCALLLRQWRAQQVDRSLSLIADQLGQMLSYKMPLASKPDPGQLQERQRQFFNDLSRQEQQSRQAIEDLFHFHGLTRVESPLLLDPNALFSQQTWQVLGLTSKQLTLASAGAGALAGAAIDLGLGGASMMMGALAGGLLAGGSVWWSGHKLADLSVGMLKLGRKGWVLGPIKHPNFGFVLLGRALLHLELLLRRSHAQRDSLEMAQGISRVWQQADTKAQAQWLYWFKQAAKQGQLPEAAEQALAALAKPLLAD